MCNNKGRMIFNTCNILFVTYVLSSLCAIEFDYVFVFTLFINVYKKKMLIYTILVAINGVRL